LLFIDSSNHLYRLQDASQLVQSLQIALAKIAKASKERRNLSRGRSRWSAYSFLPSFRRYALQYVLLGSNILNPKLDWRDEEWPN